MEIKVGEYVRVTNYENKTAIGKITEIFNEGKYCIVDTQDIDTKGQYPIEECSRHSKDILDLIEEGDVLQVEYIDEKFCCCLGIEETKDISYEQIKEEIRKGECELISILTKEQHERNCFKVGE